jgi:hypothetical protein
MNSNQTQNIESIIYTVRGLQVMLDSDLAVLYSTQTKFINRAVKRNPSRFPSSFMLQLTNEEWDNLKCQFGTSNEHGGRRNTPYVFTEQGVAMLSSVLNSEIAIQTSIQIMQSFVSMRKFLLNNASVFQRLEQVELNQLKSNERIDKIFSALEKSNTLPTQGVFFDGQIRFLTLFGKTFGLG